MAALLSFFIGLICLGNLVAQTEVPGDQCLGGFLLAIQPQSITLKFNARQTAVKKPATGIQCFGLEM
jgi:hypothetical protein